MSLYLYQLLLQLWKRKFLAFPNTEFSPFCSFFLCKKEANDPLADDIKIQLEGKSPRYHEIMALVCHEHLLEFCIVHGTQGNQGNQYAYAYLNAIIL